MNLPVCFGRWKVNVLREEKKLLQVQDYNIIHLRVTHRTSDEGERLFYSKVHNNIAII
jgi:hypothetical protein